LILNDRWVHIANKSAVTAKSYSRSEIDLLEVVIHSQSTVVWRGGLIQVSKRRFICEQHLADLIPRPAESAVALRLAHNVYVLMLGSRSRRLLQPVLTVLTEEHFDVIDSRTRHLNFGYVL
jgi:hypothetical protein